MNKPEIGQIVYSRNEKGIEEHTVLKVGRLYFYVNLGYHQQLNISLNNWMYTNEKYSQNNIQFYETKQDILDEQFKNSSLTKIRNTFDYCRGIGIDDISISDLKTIIAVIDKVLKQPKKEQGE